MDEKKDEKAAKPDVPMTDESIETMVSFVATAETLASTLGIKTSDATRVLLQAGRAFDDLVKGRTQRGVGAPADPMRMLLDMAAKRAD